VTDLPECGLGYGYDLDCGSGLVDGYGRWICFVCALVGRFIFCDSRVLAGYSDFGLRIARVVLFQMYCGLGGLDWRTPWNVLPYGCASPDR